MRRSFEELREAFPQWVMVPCEGKRPTVNGWNKATTSSEPHLFDSATAIGLVCGESSGVTVLDVDLPGLPEYKTRLASINTLRSRTPSSGYHLFFRYNKRWKTSVNAFGVTGWDIRNDNGLIILPPSTYHTERPNKAQFNGSSYKWDVRAPIACTPTLDRDVTHIGNVVSEDVLRRTLHAIANSDAYDNSNHAWCIVLWNALRVCRDAQLNESIITDWCRSIPGFDGEERVHAVLRRFDATRAPGMSTLLGFIDDTHQRTIMTHCGYVYCDYSTIARSEIVDLAQVHHIWPPPWQGSTPVARHTTSCDIARAMVRSGSRARGIAHFWAQ